MGTRDLVADPLFDRIEAINRARDSYQPNPLTAARVSTTYQRYPWMSPGVNLALAESGADDDFAAQVAAEEARHRHKRGFGWHSFGDALTAVGRLAEPVAPIVRTTFTALESPLQEVKSLIQTGLAVGLTDKSFGQALEESAFGESTGIQAVQALARGEDVDLGHGYFSGGDIRERYHSESGKLRYKGQSITLGRTIADAVSEPGSKPYSLLSGLLDAAVELGADPVTYATAGLGKVGEARRLFALEEGAGLVNGLRRTVLSETAAEWLAGSKGREVVDAIAAEGNVDALWRKLGKKPDVETVVQLADARTPDEVRSILHPKLGIEEAWREKPTLARTAPSAAFEAVFRRDIRDVRAFGDVPANKLNFTRPEDALATFDDWQLNAKVPHDIRAVNNTELARALANGSGLDRYQAVVKHGAKAVRDSLEAHGADPDRAKELTKLFVDSHHEGVKYLIDDTGRELSVRKVMVNGVEHDLPAPFWLSQALGNSIDLPNARDIKRATASPFMQTAVMNRYGDARLPIAALDKLQQDVWKPLTLIRAAWPVRVIGEEQVRMGAVGLKSAFTHPLSYIAWTVGSDSRTGRALERLGGTVGRGQLDPLGRDIVEEAAFSESLGHADEFASAMNRRATNWSGRDQSRRIRIDDWTVYDRADDDFVEWWEDNLLRVNSDPVAQRIAGGLRKGDRVPVPAGATGPRAGLDGVKDWYFDGTGRKFRDQLAEVRPELATRAGADAYIDTAWTELQRLTGGDADLLDAIASPELRRRAFTEGASGRRSELGERLRDLTDEGVGPAKVTGMKTARRDVRVDQWKEWKDRTVDRLFEVSMGIPSDKLSRSPVFRQYLWKRTEELFPNLTRDAQREVLDAAIAAKLDRKTIARIRSRALQGSGDLTAETVDTIAKHHALNRTRGLLYDLHKRNQFFDAARLVFPFGEAWKEVVGTWARIGVQHPRVVRRFQQGMEGARGGDTDPNTGFFHTNEFGEEVFSFPGSQYMTKALIGVPVPLEGRVQGLNLMAQAYPGFGPAVSVPAGYLLPDKPEWDSIREVVLPFGEPETKGGFAESFLPAWVQKLRQGLGEPADARLFANTTMDMQRYLLSTGEYSTDTPEEINRLMGDAKSKAKMLYVLRGIAQFGAPSAPTPRMLVHDRSGELVFLSKLSDEWEKLQADDYRTATEKFLGRYGENALLVMQAKTQVLSYGSPVDAEGLAWAKENSDLVSAFPHTYGLFGPQGGKFSPEAYARSIERGDRQPLTPLQAIQLANTRVANLIYHKAKDVAGLRPNAQQQAGLRMLRAVLIQRYPGFGDDIVLKTNTGTLIRELESAATDPQVVATQAGKGLAVYMAARKAAQAASEARGLSPSGFATSASMGDVRELLRRTADYISTKYPAFAAVFDQALSRELADDEPALGMVA